MKFFIFLFFLLSIRTLFSQPISIFSNLPEKTQNEVIELLKNNEFHFGAEYELGKAKRMKLLEIIDIEKYCIILDCSKKELRKIKEDPGYLIKNILKYERLNNAILAYPLLKENKNIKYFGYDDIWFNRITKLKLYNTDLVDKESYDFNGFFINSLKTDSDFLLNFSMNWDGIEQHVGLLELRHIVPVYGYEKFLGQHNKVVDFFDLNGEFAARSGDNYSIHTHVSSPIFLNLSDQSGKVEKEVDEILNLY
jgi:hypothetical protein